MKIGILTFQNADNYGAVLQAYALRQVISELRGDDVEILNYQQPYISAVYRVLPKASMNTSLKYKVKFLARNLLLLIPRIVKKYKFESFRRDFMMIGRTPFTYSLNEKIKDIYVVGSVQVWNNKITHFDVNYFLGFCKYNERRVAYAASIGSDIVSDEQMAFLRENLQNIDCISVRERYSVELIEKLSGKSVENTIDPSLLLTKDCWAQLSKKHSGRQYLLVYIMTTNPEVQKVASSIAKRLSLNAVVVNDSSVRKNQHGFKKRRNVGPLDFLPLISNAAFIVTNSFHGTAFSIIFEKNFITVPHKTTGGRMRSLLEALQLEERIVESSENLTEDFPLGIDYAVPNQLLDREREKSISFLKRAIYGETEL